MVLLTLVSCIAYTLAVLCQVTRLYHNQTWLKSAFTWISILGVCCHGYLLYRIIETPHGQNLNVLHLLSMMFWLLNISILLLAHLKQIENLALFATPPTLLVLILNIFYTQNDIVQTNAYTGMVSHILISLLATSTLCLACMQSLLVGIQNYRLKHPGESKLLSLLPPLQTMESLLFSFIWLGVIGLSFTLLSGLRFQYLYPELEHQHEIFLSFIAWVLFVGLLIGRYWLGFRVQTTVLGVSVGFTLIFISYFGSSLFCI